MTGEVEAGDRTAAADFEAERPRLAGLAYRITGSRVDAEDIVQEAWIRFQRADPATVERPAAWLTTVVGRLALDRLRSASHVRETYVGPWLPEPVVLGDGSAHGTGDPADDVVLRDSLTMAFLVLLERLAPVERVVFLLADVFGVPFEEIAATVDRSPAACRQVASRARQRVRQDSPPRFQSSSEDAWTAAVAFFAAAQAGDLDALLATLADDVVMISDGGPERRAARHPVIGPDRVARLISNLAKRLPADIVVELVAVNGEPGLVASVGDDVHLVSSVEVVDGRVRRVRTMLNPQKVAATARRIVLR